MNAIQTFQSLTTPKAAHAIADLRPGVTVKVHQRIKEGNKTRVQIFEGIIIAHKHGSSIDGTITVRKVTNGIGVERVFPLHLPTIEKFEVMKSSKVRRAKLYYLRTKTARETRRKTKVIANKTSSPSDSTSQEEEKKI